MNSNPTPTPQPKPTPKPDPNLRDKHALFCRTLQCDEPRIEPAAIELVSDLLLRRPAADMSTLSAPLERAALLDPNRVKVVCCAEAPEQSAIAAGGTDSSAAILEMIAACTGGV